MSKSSCSLFSYTCAYNRLPFLKHVSVAVTNLQYELQYLQENLQTAQQVPMTIIHKSVRFHLRKKLKLKGLHLITKNS